MAPLSFPSAGRIFSLTLGLAALTGAARADVQIVSEITVIGNSDSNATVPASPETITTDYKGNQARTEILGGPIALFDLGKDKVYRLDPAKKTYYVLPLKKMEEEQNQMPGRMAGRMQAEAQTDLKLPDTVETKTIAGVTAKKYDLSGSIRLKPKQSGNFGGFSGGGIFGSGFPGGSGGFPGGGGGSHHGRHGGGRSGRQMPVTEISGEVWLADAVKLPEDKKASALPSVQALIFGADPALKSFSDALDKGKLLPLSSTITITRDARQPRGDDQSDSGSGNDAETGSATIITTTMQVKSLSQETLPETLFQVPSGYTQVDPPSDKPTSD